MVVRFVFSLAVLVCAVSMAGCGWAQVASEGPLTKVGAEETSPSATDEPSVDDIFGPIDNAEPEPVNEEPVDDEVVEAEAAASEGGVDLSEEAGNDLLLGGTGGDDADATVQPTEGNLIAANNASASADAQKIEELTSRVAALQTEIEELKTNLYNVQQALAQAQDPGEFSQRALGAMALDADLRSTMGQMLQGKVRLINETGEPMVVYINGTPWTVVTGDSYVLAPVGKVSFLREGETEPVFKGIQEWTENDQNGQFELEYRLSDTASERSVLMKVPPR